MSVRLLHVEAVNAHIAGQQVQLEPLYFNLAAYYAGVVVLDYGFSYRAGKHNHQQQHAQEGNPCDAEAFHHFPNVLSFLFCIRHIA